MSSSMQKFTMSEGAVLHNARATFYPREDGSMQLARVQVFSTPRFRESGWETVNEEKSKGVVDHFQGADFLENADDLPPSAGSPADVARAVRRARRAAFDLIMCNPNLNAFATFTYSPERVSDKSEYGDCYPMLKNWLSNGVQRRGLVYICVPELTKKGDVHFHAICNAEALSLVEARNAKTGRLLKHHGDQVYNIQNWHAGFSTAQLIRQRSDGDDPRLAVSKYIFKYMGKNLGAKIGGRYLLKGGDFIKPVYVYGDGVRDFSTGGEDMVKCYTKDLGDGGQYWEFDFLGQNISESRNTVDSLGV